MTQLRLITLAMATGLGLAACGHDPTREEIGTVGGAAAGALIGKEVGEDMDRKRR